jgi:nascent polypeptide-associated complex subunit beta
LPLPRVCNHHLSLTSRQQHTDSHNQQIVHASVPSNTFAIYGNGEDKELTELVPGILNQLGPDSLASLRRLAESYQSLQKKEGGDKKDGGDDDDDDEIPDLVEGENFEGKVE